jgi:hypothetical protein
MLLLLVLWLEPAAWEIHVLGLGHLATITEDAIVTDLLLDGCPSLVHVLGPLVSSEGYFMYWNTKHELYLGANDGYQKQHPDYSGFSFDTDNMHPDLVSIS